MSSQLPRNFCLSADYASPCDGDSSLQIKARSQLRARGRGGNILPNTHPAGVLFVSPAAWRTNAWRTCWSPSRQAWRAARPRPVAPPSPGRRPASGSCSWLPGRRAWGRAWAWRTPWCRWRPSGAPGNSLGARGGLFGVWTGGKNGSTLASFAAPTCRSLDGVCCVGELQQDCGIRGVQQEKPPYERLGWRHLVKNQKTKQAQLALHRQGLYSSPWTPVERLRTTVSQWVISTQTRTADFSPLFTPCHQKKAPLWHHKRLISRSV